MTKVIDGIKKMFCSDCDKECFEVICQIKAEGKKELEAIRNTSLQVGETQLNTIEELKNILREQRELEVDKKQAEVKARIQQRIIDIKKAELNRKEEQKKEKVAEIKKWLESV